MFYDNEVPDLISIQTFSEWENQMRFSDQTPKYSVVFFVSPGCGACIKYKETLKQIVQLYKRVTTTSKMPKEQVEFVLFDVTHLSTDPALKTVVSTYQIRTIPTILLLLKTKEGPKLQTQLRHRNFQPIEEWIRSKWYPEKNIHEMLAVAALYEINHWRKGQYKDINQFTQLETQRQLYFGHLIHNFENKYLDEHVLLGWIPHLFVSTKDKKRLEKIANKSATLSESAEWQTWVRTMQQKIQNRSASHMIELDQTSQLPSNEKVRDFLIKEFYHFLLKNQVEIFDP